VRHNDRATAVMNLPVSRQDVGLYGAGQIVAVADSGLDTGDPATIHPDFRGKIVNASCLVRIDPCNWADDNGHGTQFAGSVLGSGIASGANPAQRRYSGSLAGSAPEARLRPSAAGEARTSCPFMWRQGPVLQPRHGFRVTFYADTNVGGVSTSFTAIATQHPDMRTPPAGYSGPWVGSKTISSVRLEIVQLDANGNLPSGERVEGSFGSAVFLPLALTAN
jgi:hypothetical protein